MVIFTSTLASCNPPVIEYPVPPQYAPAAWSVNPRDFMLEMNDRDAPAHFIADILPDLHGGLWRWTGRRPTVSLPINPTGRFKYVVDFVLWEEALKQTGPVVLTFTVNDHVLSRVPYGTPGKRHFEKSISTALVGSTGTSLAVEIDKLYVGADGNTFGFILVRIGLIPE